jgi:murein DD-endopeptidase MepM/ murein hydrolase activator NlpD
MGKKTFRFDPVTHQFLPVKRTRGEKILRTGAIVIASLMLAVLVRYSADHNFTHPKETILITEKEALIGQYLTCEERIRELEMNIAELQARDDNIYRAFYELEPIPLSDREAGFGGSARYRNLEGFDSSPLMIGLTQRVDHADIRLGIQTRSFGELLSKADQHADLILHKPSIQPISLEDFYWISSVFGYRTDPMTKRRAMHFGVDFAGMVGLNVYATGDGIVKSIKILRGGTGKTIVIDHGFGYTSLYGHLHDIFVHKGQKIKRGMVIGTVGNTGKSTGPHLHYEVHSNNRAMNPKHFYAEDLTPEEYSEIVNPPEEIDN